MFYFVLKSLFPVLVRHSPLHLFSYTTVRAACALFFAFGFSLVFGPACLRWLASLRMGQQVRNFRTSETQQFNIHPEKAGTTTMGGILIVAATLSSVILFCDPASSYVWAVAAVMLVTGALGFVDDLLKVRRKNHKGVSAIHKLAVQIAVGVGLGAFLVWTGPYTTYAHKTITSNTHLLIPFFKNLYPDLGLFFIAWVAFVLCATSNAVNLTDGLDGLAIGATIVVCLPYMVIAYLVSRFDYAGFLLVPHVPQARELAVFLAALLGAGMGFLWFNAHPAQVFMGDTGSLSLGAVVGSIAILCKHEMLLVLIGGIFVIEALSVVVQVAYFKRTGKRFFLMSPLHNHFLKKGMKEQKIIARFLIIAVLLALVGLSSLKLR
jgi:phospho-N-acetylmuramoyl-pentapeptide-transferase